MVFNQLVNSLAVNSSHVGLFDKVDIFDDQIDVDTGPLDMDYLPPLKVFIYLFISDSDAFHLIILHRAQHHLDHLNHMFRPVSAACTFWFEIFRYVPQPFEADSSLL